MRRKHVRALFLALPVLGLAALVAQVWRSVEDQQSKEFDRTSLEGMLPDAVQWIKNFRRIEIQDGKTAWEVQGDEAQYLEDKGYILVRQPKVALVTQEGEKVAVSGGEATVVVDGKDLKEVTLRGNVEVLFRDFVIHAPNAVFRQDLQTIVVDGEVHIRGARLELAGTDMTVFMEDSRFELGDPVRMTLLPSAPAPPRS